MSNSFGIVNDLARHIGQTVTIFTTSGGQSGRGFTGILANVNNQFVRLITQIGSAPGCALGNCCDDRCDCEKHDSHRDEEFGEEFRDRDRDRDRNRDRNRDRDRFDCSGRTLGSIVDIPVDRIAAFVHNSVGSGW
jgi:hypothetical protein